MNNIFAIVSALLVVATVVFTTVAFYGEKSRDYNILVMFLLACGSTWVFSAIWRATNGEYGRAALDMATSIPAFCAGWVWIRASKLMKDMEKSGWASR